MIARTTEQPSTHRHLEQMPLTELLTRMNAEDQTVATAVARSLPQITALTEAIVAKMRNGGRLFYIGAGTSGRLGIVDASECPPTFGVPQGLVIGIIAGGDGAIRQAVEFAEDDTVQAWHDLQSHHVCDRDVVVGIAASGTTPYVIGGLSQCRAAGITTGCLVCNEDSPVAAQADFAVAVIVGPEFVTGSTRLKSGTAQKLVLNMVSTATMIQLGRVRDNSMVDMQLTNDKLVDRGELMIMRALGVSRAEAADLLELHGSVRRAIDAQVQ